jgi:nicotinamide riboside transporter PnuC
VTVRNGAPVIHSHQWPGNLNAMTAAKIFGREPALWAALLNVLVYVLCAWIFHPSPQVEAAVIAVVSAVLGMVVAFSTKDGVSAAILGLVKSVLALLLGFGLKMSADQQAGVLALAAALTGMFVRTQVTALIGPDGAKRTTA